MNILIVQPRIDGITETFLRAQAEKLPGRVFVATLAKCVALNGRPVHSQTLAARAWRKAGRFACGRAWSWERTNALVEAIRRSRADVVLAQYGPTGVQAMEACQRMKVPLVVHFHGFDASRRQVLEDNRETYSALFQQAAAVIAVSSAMERQLESLGCPRGKLYHNVYGVDCQRFSEANPSSVPPIFLAVGRFVDKKAPHLTLYAFAEVIRRVPDARLRMIGDGPLLPACRDLAIAAQISDHVEFLGAQPHDRVAVEFRRSRSFVQHSVQASDGNCEGTPVAILEAGACGLPVIATRHAGIPDVVVEGETGLLVNERDVTAMSKAMVSLAESPAEAARMGQNARELISRRFTTDISVSRLADILHSVSVRPFNFRSARDSGAEVVTVSYRQ